MLLESVIPKHEEARLLVDHNDDEIVNHDNIILVMKLQNGYSLPLARSMKKLSCLLLKNWACL